MLVPDSVASAPGTDTNCEMTLLTVKHLSVQFEDRSVVEDLSFELAAGERLSILGPNGAGKTVLLKALLNLLPYRGEVRWSDDVRIGYVPQKIDADTHLPLTFTDLFRAKCLTLNIAFKQVAEIAGTVGLTEQILSTPVGHLSGGQFQRGLIGFSLIGNPNERE